MIERYTCSVSKLPYFIQKLKKNRTPPIIDFIKEKYQINNVSSIIHSIQLYDNNLFAIKLSSIGIHQNVSLCYDHLIKIIDHAIKNNSKILIDAEEHQIQDKIDDITNSVLPIYNKNSVNVYKTYQMYKKDSMSKFLHDMNKSRDYDLGIKLVRGAYLHKDKNKNVLWDSEDKTHDNYNQAILHFSYQSKMNDILMCATHNKKSIEIAYSVLNNHTQQHQLQFSQLMGMSNQLTDSLAKKNLNVYKYLPYGNLYDSIPYLTRRLVENTNMIKYLI